jgi:sporulation protein YlmC with PRC-barrel domain
MSKSARFVPTIRLKMYDVVNKQGQDMGQVQTFVVDMNEGLIAFALVSFGGFLGLDDKWFAMPWNALQWQPEDM